MKIKVSEKVIIKKGDSIGLEGFEFQHLPGKAVAHVSHISKPDSDGSFTVTLTDIKPAGRRALGL